MAQFTAGGRLKSIFTGNGLSVGFDGFHHHYKIKSFSGNGGGFTFTYSPSVLPQVDRKRKLCASTVNASTSSSSSTTNTSGGVFDEVLEEDQAEFEIDELAGFRGLVLDISYRWSPSNLLYNQIATHFKDYFTLFIPENGEREREREDLEERENKMMITS